MFLLYIAILACVPQSNGTLASGAGGGGGSASTACPSGMTEVLQNRVTLGESDLAMVEAYPGTVILPNEYVTSTFCVGTFPLPGSSGQAWPSDGLSVAQLPPLESLLAEHGRRLCTVPELLLAAAGPENWRFPTDADQHVDGACEPDEFNPQPLGTYSNCESPTGVRDLGVRSSWALLDALTADSLAESYPAGFPGGGDYAAWGGTSSQDTTFAPSNFGVHFQGAEEDPYLNNGLRVCADPDQVDAQVESGWSDQVEALVQTGTFADWLAAFGS